jgi:ABC-type phosphonate transport system ATPase subunit
VCDESDWPELKKVKEETNEWMRKVEEKDERIKELERQLGDAMTVRLFSIC